MSSKARKALPFILYNIVVVALFLGVIEFTLHSLLHHSSQVPKFLLTAYRKYYAWSVRSTIQMEPACAQYDSSLFYTLKPGHCTFSNLEFTHDLLINSLGVRDTEAALNSPEIIFLGDSFTMGWGVPEDSCYVRHYGKTKNKRVLNAGISSYGTIRELRLLSRIKRDSLKILVIQYHDSDILENREFITNDNTLKISSRDAYEKYSRNVRAQSGYFFGKHTAFIGKYWVKDIMGHFREKAKPDEAKSFTNALLHSPVPLTGINIVVFETFSYNHERTFLDDLKKEIDNNSYPDYIKNIKIVKLEGILSTGDYYILDDHLNSSGHKKIADKLLQIL